VPPLKMPAALGWRFGLVVLLLAIFSLLLGTQNAVDVNRNTQCLAAYSSRSAEVQAIRSAATAERDAAVAALLGPLTEVIIDVTRRGGDPTTPEEIRTLRRAAKAYKQSARELAIKRAQNPLPSFPSRCSDINQ